MRPLSILLVALMLWVGQAAGLSLAGQPKDYAYLAVQGKLSRAGDGRALVGVTVTLRGKTEQFTTVTDTRGVFVFDKLPLARYSVEVRTADGKTIRNVRRFETPGPELTMLELGVRGGARNPAAEPIVIDGSNGSVEVVVPDPRTKWGKLWKQALIFVGVAGAFAL